ncbi:acyltransferase family protein [Treponema sp.]|uniref:acyltransferase family protein n=1 Tax=Treponema sp. TaxID=166 RepID=UPI00388E2931
MLISILIYGFTLALLFWGSSFATKGQLKADYLSIENSTAAKGFACLGVFFHHVSQNPAFQQTADIKFFEYIGFIFVGIFFFYSGIGLLKSWKAKPDYLSTFFKKRMLPIIIAIYVMNIFYAIFICIAKYREMDALRWVLGLLNIIILNDQSWYPIVILIMYAAFMFAFKKCKKVSNAIFVVFLVALAQLVIFCIGGHFAWWIDYGWYKGPQSFGTAKWYQQILALWFQGEWWVNSTMCFVMGLLWAHHEEKIIAFFSKKYWLKFSLLGILMAGGMYLGFYTMMNISYWSEFAGHGVGRIDKTICLVSQQVQLATLLAFLTVLKFKWTRSNKVLSFFSSISLEFYLMQRIALNSFLFITGTKENPIIKELHWNLLAYFIAVFAANLLLALIYKQINKKITKLLVR